MRIETYLHTTSVDNSNLGKDRKKMHFLSVLMVTHMRDGGRISFWICASSVSQTNNGRLLPIVWSDTLRFRLWSDICSTRNENRTSAKLRPATPTEESSPKDWMNSFSFRYNARKTVYAINGLQGKCKRSFVYKAMKTKPTSRFRIKEIPKKYVSRFLLNILFITVYPEYNSFYLKNHK